MHTSSHMMSGYKFLYRYVQGVITEDVIQLRKSIGAPGMAVLQFGIELLLI